MKTRITFAALCALLFAATTVTAGPVSAQNVQAEADQFAPADDDLQSSAEDQSDASDADEQRYQLVETEEGVLRLDRQSGDVSLCSSTNDRWTCRLVADDRVAYEVALDEAEERLADLQSQVDEMSALLSEEDADTAQLDDPVERSVNEAIDKASEVAKTATGRFLEMLGDAEEELDRLQDLIETYREGDGGETQ